MEPYQPDSSDLAMAFRSVRSAKNLFWWLLLAAVLVQMATFVLIRFVGVLDGAPQVIGQMSTRPAGHAMPADQARFWYDLCHWVLPASKFIGLLAALLLTLTILFAVKLALLGRLGGISGLVSAFFWSLILLVLVVPWQQAFISSFAAGSMYNLSDLEYWTHTLWRGEKSAPLTNHILYYARFLAYPGVALLTWLIVQAKFARGLRSMNLPPTVSVSPRPEAPFGSPGGPTA